MQAQLAYLLFEIRRMVRNKRYMLFTLGFPVLFYLLFLHVTGSSGPEARIAGTTWGAYYMVSMASFAAMIAGFNAGGPRLAGERASGWVRQLRVTPLPGWAYVTTKLSAGMVAALPALLLVEIVGAASGHVHLAGVVWLEISLVIWVGAIPFAALGVLLGFLVGSETSYPLTNAVVFLLAFFGGEFTPVKVLPPVMKDIAKAMPTYNFSSLGWSLLAREAPNGVHILILVGYLAVFSLLVIWRYRGDQAHLVG